MIKTYILSYPKCGRTWVQLLLGHLMSMEYSGFPSDYFINRILNDSQACLKRTTVQPLPEKWLGPDIPSITFSHANSSSDSSQFDSSKFSNGRIVLLLRDPRDVIVSYYFHMTRRVFAYTGTLHAFLRDERYGIMRIVRFYNFCRSHLSLAAEVHILTYENLVKMPEETLSNLCCYLRLHTDADRIRCAIAACCFNNMRRMECENTLNQMLLQPGNPSDLESYKTRRGKVGGYSDYLDQADIDLINYHINEHLDPFFINILEFNQNDKNKT